jgi:O-glycosyl hydrolase
MSIKQLFFLLLLTSACSDSTDIPPPPGENLESGEVTVTLSDERQTIHSFGASDCWTGKFIGKWSDATKKNRIADLLFSMDTLSSGSPKGIGLSLWRFNIGAGSFEQGVNSNITDEWRREESFQLADGSYDWDKHEGQRWFLQAAKQRGVKYSLGFSISPPVHMTGNGKAFSPGGNQLNIQSDKMDEFADFLVEVSRQMEFDYLSPANEPQWPWAASNGFASQEGTPAQNSELSTLANLLSERIETQAIKTRVVIAEAAQLDFLYGRNNDGRGDQVSQFFGASSPNFVGNLPSVDKIISAHSYFTTCPDDNLISVRQTLANKVKQVDPSLQVWQTEFGILGDICGKYNGYPRNTGIDYGLYVAKTIHHDLAIANVSGWHWWLAMSPYDYSDALVYINAPDGSMNLANSKNDGQVLDSKQLWAFGNFARFVRPGMVRVAVTLKGMEDPIVAAGSTMVSAYKDLVTKTLVIVVVNTKTGQLKLNLKGVSVPNSQVKVYTTSASKNLQKSSASVDNIPIDKRSVTTIVGKYQ